MNIFLEILIELVTYFPEQPQGQKQQEICSTATPPATSPATTAAAPEAQCRDDGVVQQQLRGHDNILLQHY